MTTGRRRDTPQDGISTKGTFLDTKAPLLYGFARGGGLLLHDESYDQVYVTENRFLQPLGAEIVNELVTAPQRNWRQPDYLIYPRLGTETRVLRLPPGSSVKVRVPWHQYAHVGDVKARRCVL